MDDNRLRFYDRYDFSVGLYLGRMKELIDSLDTSKAFEEYEITDILEYMALIKFIENGISDKRWDESYIEKVKNSKGSLFRIIDGYAVSVEIKDVSKDIDNRYYNEFQQLIKKSNVSSPLGMEEFETLLEDSKIPLWSVLKSPYLVQTYGEIVAERFLSSPNNVELLIKKFTSSRQSDINIPPIPKQEMLQLCKDYIESEDANLNYVRLLSKPITGINTYVDIDPSTKLQAKRKAEEIEEELLKNQSTPGLEVSLAVFKSEDKFKKRIEDNDTLGEVALVSEEWIKRHRDFPTLLNNFQYLYDYFTPELIFSLPSYPNLEMDIMERVMGVQSANSYRDGMAFSIKLQMAHIKMRVIKDILQEIDVSVEDLIRWFFEVYSKDEFGIDWLPLSFPANEESFENKASTIFRVEESIRTQYGVLFDTGLIDRELVSLTTTPRIQLLKSSIENKYGYLTDDEDAQVVSHNLFSTQSHITYAKEGLSADTFLNLILHNKVKLEDFPEHSRSPVQFLLDKQIIAEANNDKSLNIQNAYEVSILQRLFLRGVIAYNHLSEGEQKIADEFAAKGWLGYSDSFFAEPESSFLNYLLNDSVYDNSLGIRNSYQHGTPAYEGPLLFERDYYLGLLVLLLYVIKINDEFTLRNKLAGKELAYAEVDLA